MPKPKSKRARRPDNLARLRAQLAEAVETLEAIRSGSVDALVVQGEHGEQVFTLKGAEQVYRLLVEAMNEGAVSLSPSGCILYSNARFSELVRTPLEKVIGAPFCRFVSASAQTTCSGFLKKSLKTRGTIETVLAGMDGMDETTVLLSSNPFPGGNDIGCSLVITDITYRMRAELAQREVAKKVLEAQEQERHRVSRELHDGISQLLSSARHRLFDVQRDAARLSGARLMKSVGATGDLLERAMQEVRLISRGLRPVELDDLGLAPAIASLVENFEQDTRIEVNCRCDLNGEVLPKPTELALYRIVQEALTNVSKHSQASRVLVRLGPDDNGVKLCIRDNGRGFNPALRHGGLGLANMQERAAIIGAAFNIRSSTAQGTEISVKLP